jgi:hypothetical protein
VERLLAATEADGAGLAQTLERLRARNGYVFPPEAPGALAARIAALQALDPAAPVLGMLVNRARMSVRISDASA